MNVLRKTPSFTASVRAICGCLGLALLSGCATEVQPEDDNETSSDVQAKKSAPKPAMRITRLFEVDEKQNATIEMQTGRKICFGKAVHLVEGDTSEHLVIWTQRHKEWSINYCDGSGTIETSMLTLVEEGQAVATNGTFRTPILLDKIPVGSAIGTNIGHENEARTLTSLCKESCTITVNSNNKLVIKQKKKNS
jgi:hypothetical protein